MTARFGLEAAADLYQQVRARAQADGVRLTAQITNQVAKAVLKRAGQQAEGAEFTLAAQQLITTQVLPIAQPVKRPRAAATTTSGSSIAAAAPDLRNFAEGYGEVTISPVDGGPQVLRTAGTEAEEATMAPVGPVAECVAGDGRGLVEVPVVRSPVALYRDVCGHVQAIDQLSGSACLQLKAAEEAEFDWFHLQITNRLAAVLRSIVPSH